MVEVITGKWQTTESEGSAVGKQEDGGWRKDDG
jgi:hypothetical protein